MTRQQLSVVVTGGFWHQIYTCEMEIGNIITHPCMDGCRCFTLPLRAYNSFNDFSVFAFLGNRSFQETKAPTFPSLAEHKGPRKLIFLLSKRNCMQQTHADGFVVPFPKHMITAFCFPFGAILLNKECVSRHRSTSEMGLVTAHDLAQSSGLLWVDPTQCRMYKKTLSGSKCALYYSAEIRAVLTLQWKRRTSALFVCQEW